MSGSSASKAMSQGTSQYRIFCADSVPILVQPLDPPFQSSLLTVFFSDILLVLQVAIYQEHFSPECLASHVQATGQPVVTSLISVTLLGKQSHLHKLLYFLFIYSLAC
jgi:hypothetical protein